MSTLPNYTPVSYTHLDVYKRQIIGTDTLQKIDAIIDFKNNKLMCTVSNKEHSVELGLSLIHI